MTETTKTPKAKKQKAIKIVSPKELKAWLRGIQEFQPEGWTPSCDQWDAIRERIFLLDEAEFSSEVTVNNQQVSYTPTQPFTPVGVAPTVAYTAIGGNNSGPSGALSDERSLDSGHLAVAKSPTESGMVSASSQATVLEGEYKTPF